MGWVEVKGNLGSVGLTHPYVGSNDWTRVTRLVWQVLLCPHRFTLFWQFFFWFCFCLFESELQFSKSICEFMPWRGRSTISVDLERCELGRFNQAPLFSILEIIDDLANLVENTDEKLRTEARRVTLVDRKSTSCGKRWQLPHYLAGVCSSLHVPCCFYLPWRGACPSNAAAPSDEASELLKDAKFYSDKIHC